MSVHPETRRASATSSSGASRSRRRWASRRPFKAHMRSSLTRMVADARLHLHPLCSCGGGGGGVGNPTAWDNGADAAPAAKPTKGGMLLSPVAALGTPLLPLRPLPPLNGLDVHRHGGRDGARRQNGGATQAQGYRPSPRSPGTATEGEPAQGRRDSFSEALQPLVRTSEVFLVLPVRARRWSRLARTVVLMTLMTSLMALSALRMFKEGVSLTSSLFYGTATIAVYLLSDLSSQWPGLSARWRASGSPLTLTAPLQLQPHTDTKLCWSLAIVMLVCALVEHVLSILTDLVPLIPCAEQGGAWAVYKSFFLNKFPMVYEVLPFSTAASVPLLYLNLTCTFLWNVIDIVVVVFSSLLAGRFRRLNRFLEKAKGKDFSRFWWQEVRESYNRLAVITKHFDAHISGIVLLSFASNLFFICLQLLYNMTKQKSKSLLAHLYFYFSFAWLLVRTAVVSMSAASVYEQSMGPIEVLYCVPSKSFCVEVQRFLVQVTTDTVALTGCRFFWVTRSLILTLVGTVATYEIVLVQFHGDKDKAEHEVTACSE